MSGDDPTFRLLGPVDVRAGVPVTFVRPQHRDLLAWLILNAGRAVTVEAVAEAIWGGAAPRTARTQVHNMVSGIRATLGRCAATFRLEHGVQGYVLHVRHDDVDVLLFEDLVKQARSEPDEHAGAALLRRALGLWGGKPLANVRAAYAIAARQSLCERHASALEALFEVELSRGRHVEVATEAERWTDEYPFRETLARQRITALYRCGRRTDALAAYDLVTSRIAVEHGLDPGPELQEVQLAVLRDDHRLDAPRPLRPLRQLPPDITGFVGRPELGVELCRPGQPLVVLSGMPGAGKTVTAVHAAHEAAAAYPDGQLYVDLRGFGVATPMTATEALRGFLYALGVRVEQLPAALAPQIALFRSLLADRRMLLVLDNARDPAQVRPLLPGTGGCSVLVTSRDRLSGLAVSDGARLVGLEPMGRSQALGLLSGRLGTDRPGREPRAADEIVARCAGLPLALAVVAARAAESPDRPLDAVAAELRGTGSRLDAFAGDDPATDPRAVFSWSYDALAPEVARLFRLLGTSGADSIGWEAAASLAGRPVHEVVPLLRRLTRLHLVGEPRPGRVALHDLMRAYAGELTDGGTGAAGRGGTGDLAAATARLLDHYTVTARAAAGVLHPYGAPIAGPPATEGVVAVPITNPDEAVTWFESECDALLASIRQGARAGRDDQVLALVSSLSGYLAQVGRWHDWVDIEFTALTIAERSGDRRAQAVTNRCLARACTRSGRMPEAARRRERALALFGELVDLRGRAGVLLDLAEAYADGDERSRAGVRHAEEAARLFRLVDDRPGEGRALNQCGWLHTVLGEHERALARCREALAIQQGGDDVAGQGATLDSLGRAYRHLGRTDEAITSYRLAVDLLGRAHERGMQAGSLEALGDTCAAAGDVTAAREAWRRCLAVLDDLGLARPDGLVAKVAGVRA